LRQAEKMAALGKLSAGLAHELNNPAAAATRASGQMADALRDLQTAMISVAATGLTPDDWSALATWEADIQGRASEALDLSPMEASDREEEMITWLEACNVDEAWSLASTLVATRLSNDDLERLAGVLPGASLGPAITWLCCSFAAQDLAEGVARSTGAISKLVNAAKSFSFMDQAPIQNVDIHDGLEDTITMLGSRVGRGMEIIREYDRNLPHIEVPASELNQVLDEPARQRHGGEPQRRQDHRAYVHGRRSAGGGDHRPGSGHRAGDPGQDLRPVLHHQRRG
jgi:signal transduction histidine kinase